MRYWIFFVVMISVSLCESATTYKKFVILMTGRNVAAWCEKSLSSALSQDYKGPWRIIFVADAPTDSTVKIAEQTIAKYGSHDRVTMVVNPVNQGAMYNQYVATHSMQPDEICVILDSDDWFAHRGVLSYLNTVYADPEVWLTYGQFQFVGGAHGFCKPYPQWVLEQNAFRSYNDYLSSHPRTYYAWLFQLIRKEDLMRDGAFFDYAPDLAAMMPMLEMARKGHIRSLARVLYIYNDHNPHNESNRTSRGEYAKKDHAAYIRSLPPYPAVDASPLGS